MKESFRFRGWKKAVHKVYSIRNRKCGLTNERLYELWKQAYEPADVYREEVSCLTGTK